MARQTKRDSKQFKSASLDLNSHEILKHVVEEYELASLSAAIRKLAELAGLVVIREAKNEAR